MAAKEKKVVENTENIAEEAKKDTNAQIEQMKSFFAEKLSKLDSQVKDISNNVKNKYVPQAENKIKENLLISLAVSFAAGLCLGFIFMIFSFIGGGKRR